MAARDLLVNLLRGALIGVTEIIPGVSGGTIALLIGVYERLIESAGALVRGVVRAAIDVPRGRGAAAARAHLRAVSWATVVPVAVGMLVAVVTAARVVGPLVEAHPVVSRALFAGLIVTSLVVPARMVGGRWRARDWALAVPAAMATFLATGLTTVGAADPGPLAILVTAAVAVCALVLPGVSGAFMLVASGMYEPTLRALSTADAAYIATFVVGAILGLAGFVQLLLFLLSRHRRVTLTIMTGLMAGSLRALWPWQTEERELLAPSGDVVSPLVGFALGVVVVAVLLTAETIAARRALRRSAEPDAPAGDVTDEDALQR